MTVTIKSTDSVEQVDFALKKIRAVTEKKKSKVFDAWKYFGRVKVNEDAIVIQNNLRNE